MARPRERHQPERPGGRDERRRHPTRRELVRAAGAAFAAVAVPSDALGSSPPRSRSGAPAIGIQLYSVRTLLRADFEGTLARLAEIGYEEVELAGLHGRAPAQVRAALDRLGLRAPAGHQPLEAVRDRLDRVLEEAQTLGQQYIVVPWLDPALRTPGALREVAALFNRAGEGARRAGLELAYHNHDFEFRSAGGIVPYDYLLLRTDPALVRMELDLFWIRKGGADPLEYFARWPGRFPLVHLKDMAADGRMVDLGDGAIDWPAILARGEQAGIRHCFVEHDEPEDPLDFARKSLAYLRRSRF